MKHFPKILHGVSEFFPIFASGMKKSTKHRIDTILLYIAATSLCCAMFSFILCHLAHWILPTSGLAVALAMVISYLLAILFVIHFVRCRPLTEEEKEEGFLFRLYLEVRRP